MIDIEIKDHLAEKCCERNISIAELCRQVDMDPAGVYRRNNFRLSNIAKILTVLDCKFEDLFEIIVNK